MIAFSGVRSSCDMFARNSLLCRLAVSSSPYSLWSSSFVRLTSAASAPSSSRLGTSTWLEKSPVAISASRDCARWSGPVSARDRTNPSSRARKTVPAATPMKRFRELSYALRFCAIRAFVLSVAVSASVAAASSSSTESPARARAVEREGRALEPVILPTVSFTPA